MLTSANPQTVNDWALYFVMLAGGFVSDNWYQIIFLTIAAVHAFVAWDKNRREREARKELLEAAKQTI
jgi:hypothetical protein